MRYIAMLFLIPAIVLGCANTCETPAASVDTAAASADDNSDDDGCRLRCGDYGSCSDRLPYCCKGICQADACK